MKKKKHYNTREEIISDIDKAKKLLANKINQAEELDAEATRHFNVKGDRAGYHHLKAEKLLIQARKLKRFAFLIEGKRLPRLSRTLAAFDTEILKMDGNESKPVVIKSA